jgi:hypothetical protein
MGINKGKAEKVLSQAFVENNAAVSEDEASAKIVQSEQKIRELKNEMNNDAKLNAARQVAKDLGAGYGSAIKYEQAKIQFLLDKIEEIQSGEVNPTSSAK